ncbi:Glycosyltransferase involved in cell wall bisynthesis [Lutibacter agarilyticus]|uniref:Glycosyltransferase involved in cell wall bisynthesis n=1 Tax=Lutibacter agarilyticus TaxID=1109740 RepID=A0A238YVE6_9FLAO|nr:glycosyltransferase family 4 protein [Lutibacter agarilyticus]SNR74614.1 Glycosyltransferase involved in cell wall bisynthesis [Lutibacter agarilyticus]
MNILLISAVFPPEPIVSASLSKDIAHKLSKNNNVTVLCPKPTRPHGFNFENEPEVEEYNVIKLSSYTCSPSKIIGRFMESYSFGKHCYKYIVSNHKNIDVIYANTWPLLAQYFSVKAAKKYKLPIIIHVQDVYPESLSNKVPLFKSMFNFMLLPIDKYVLKNATKIIAISNKMKNYLIKTRKVESEKVNVVQNWQDESVFLDYEVSNLSRSTIEKPFTFMYLGNIGPVAGIDLLIEAFVKADLKNCRLVIAGSGSQKELLQEKANALKPARIEFWEVPNGKVPEIQAQADVMLLPIKKGAAASSIPSKLPAYMFSKKPIIACVDDDSDTARIINAANCGWLLAPENISILADKFKLVFAISESKLLDKGNNGYDYAMENLSKKKNLNKLASSITII